MSTTFHTTYHKQIISRLQTHSFNTENTAGGIKRYNAFFGSAASYNIHSLIGKPPLQILANLKEVALWPVSLLCHNTSRGSIQKYNPHVLIL